MNTTESSAHPAYRADIDGLRAIAVLSVVVFHAMPDRLKGGFIGVDVFFVISGFLISTILFRQFDAGSFSLTDFYARRVRRIFPALLLVLGSCLGLGWFVLLADEYGQLGQHTAAGAGFVANLLLWSESGYFDTAADSKPLLHLWSLGIEEQFYIVWPLLLWLAWRRGWNRLSVLAGLALLSFAVNVAWSAPAGVAAFYAPQTRFWELLVGAALAHLTLLPTQPLAAFTPLLRQLQAWLGLLLLAIGLALLDKGRAFPGWWALLPTLGAALLIAAGSQTWLNRKLLANRLMVWIGLISFPLYLWHWPLLAFVRIIEGTSPSNRSRNLALLVAVLLAWLTYRFVERVVRGGARLRLKTVSLLAAMVLIAIFGLLLSSQQGLPQREVVQKNPSLQRVREAAISVDTRLTAPGCGLNDASTQALFAVCRHDVRQTARLALIGDSKATALFDGLVGSSSDAARWLYVGGTGEHGATVPVLSELPAYQSYQHLAPLALQAVARNPQIEVVALVMATRALFQLPRDDSIDDLPASPLRAAAEAGVRAALLPLLQAGKRVLLVVDNPTLADPRRCIQRATSLEGLNRLMKHQDNARCRVTVVQHLAQSKPYRELLQAIAEDHPGRVQVFDTLSHLCDLTQGLCLPHRDGELLYSYTDHISHAAALSIGADLNARVLQWLDGIPVPADAGR